MTRKIVRLVAIVLGPPSLYVLARSVWFWPIEAFDAYAVFRSGLIAPILGLLWVEAAVAVLWVGRGARVESLKLAAPMLLVATLLFVERQAYASALYECAWVPAEQREWP